MKVSAIVLLGCLASVGLAGRLEDEFCSPPHEYRPETWFHINGNNISKEGLTKDLEAIKAAGLQGIQLFNKSGPEYPGVAQVKILSAQWEELMRHTAEECRRLGLTFTLQNCPGWSMAGGPWVPVEEAQRELVYTVTRLQGDQSYRDTLAVDKAFFGESQNYQDISVLAFPTPKDDDRGVLIPAEIKTNNKGVNWKRIFDPALSLKLPTKNINNLVNRYKDLHVTKVKGQETYVQVRFAQPVTLRSLVLPPVRQMLLNNRNEPKTDITLTLESVDRGRLTPVAQLRVPSSCWMDKQYDVTLAVPEMNTQELRITFGGSHEIFLAYLFFQSQTRLHNWEAKVGLALRSLEQEVERDYGAACYVDPGAVIDLTDRMDGSGRLGWDVPQGDWTVVRYGHVNMRQTNSPAEKEASGWECSKLDKIGLEHHLRKGMVGRLIDSGACGDGKLHGLLIDSWERMIPTWTIDRETVFREFLERRGYDMRSYMPALMGYILQSPTHTEKFLRDVRETMDDLFVENFFARFQALAHEFGTILYTESATGDVLPGDALRYYGVSDVPMPEYWYSGESSKSRLDNKPTKYAASAAHVYNKKRVAAEACTQGGCNWREHPYDVKALMDYHYALGVNHVVFHTFSHTPQVEVYPGSSFGGTTGFPLVRNQTWWRHMPAWTDYITRCQYMLQQGEYVADVLWYLGDELERPPFQTAPFPDGYQYDLVNSEVLHNRLSVHDGKIRVKDGGEYRIIVLRNSKLMLSSTAERLKELVLAGAVILGDKPQDSPSLMDGPDGLSVLKEIADELWGTGASGAKSVGKGKVYWGKSLEDVLREEAIAPDVLMPQQADIGWIHRRIDDTDLYFLSSQSKDAVGVSVGFRVMGKSPELWDSLTGQRREFGVWQAQNGRTYIPLSLAPKGSAIVVFRKKAEPNSWTKVLCDGKVVLDSTPGWYEEYESKTHVVTCEVGPDSLTAWESGQYELIDTVGQTKHVSVTAKSQQIEGPWRAEFEKGWDTPDAIELPKLTSLSDCSDRAVRYYSGTTTYRQTVQLSTLGDRLMLDLGDVANIAEVWCNGQNVGTRWCLRFTFDLSKAARRGRNELVIKVTNTWRNQLIYDLSRQEGQRKTWTTNPPRRPDESPAASGLIGPVVIYIGSLRDDQ